MQYKSMVTRQKEREGKRRKSRTLPVPVQSLAVADIWIPPGESHQDVPEFLDAACTWGGIVLVVGQSTQQVQLDLLRGRVGLVPGHI